MNNFYQRYSVRLFIALMVCYLPCKSQNTMLPLVSPVTPNAASLFKLTDRPPGNYNGTVPVDFPLGSVNSGSLTVPVSLSYNMGGIKVEEIAGIAGLGFNLSAGGRITRIKKGYMDEMRLSGSLRPADFDCANTQHFSLGGPATDLEPDIFMYSFNGESGKFYLTDDGDVILHQKSGLKIERLTSAIGGFEWLIIDEKGSKYYFGANKDKTLECIEVSYNSYDTSNGPVIDTFGGYISSWLLTEIYDMNEENHIKFTYQKNNMFFSTISGESMKIAKMYDANAAYNGTQDGCDPLEPDYSGPVTVTSHVEECILTRIEGNSGYIVFDSDQNRVDCSYGSKLKGINIYDYNNVLKKRYNFNYSYFGFIGADALANTRSSRLKLLSFSEFGSIGSDSLNYKFEYEENVSLPGRFSYEVDYWGYYNGRPNSGALPNIIVPITSFNFGPYIIRDDLADKTANPTYSIANSLLKITYPTGGYRQFEYEGNQALVEPNDQMGIDNTHLVNKSFIENFNFINSTTFIPDLQKSFTINSTNGQAMFDWSIDGIVYNPELSNYAVYIYEETDSNSFYLTNPTIVAGFMNTMSGRTQLVNGNYRMAIFINEYCVFNSATASWRESTSSTAQINQYGSVVVKNNRNVGGLRIKAIHDYDPVSNKTNTTRYSYQLYSLDSTLTSGLLITPVRVATVVNYINQSCVFLRLSASSCYPLATQGGSYVVYPEVRTYEQANGYTDRKFGFISDYTLGISIMDFPVPDIPDGSIFRGQLLSEKTFAQNKTLLHKKDYGYVFSLIENLYGRKLHVSWTCRFAPTSPCYGQCISYRVMDAGFTNLQSIVDSTFTATGVNVAITDYSYYTNLGRTMLSKTNTLLNNNQIKTVNYHYAFNDITDFTFGLSTAEQSMKAALLAKNYLQPLEETETITSLGGSPFLLGGMKYSFGTFNTNKLHLAGAKAYSSASDYRETIFSAYDGKGNLLEKYQQGGIKEVYIWGYNGNYPVAKITGSDFATISPWLNTLVLNNPSNDVTLRTHLDAVRSNLSLSPAQISSYTYTPSVGMSSATDAKRLTQYYEYDNFQRLRDVKDQDGNILKKYEYHYKP